MDILEAFFFVAAVIFGIAGVLLTGVIVVLGVCYIVSAGAWPAGFAEML